MIIFLLALTTGFAVSSIYLIQPLLDTLARELQVSHEKAGALMTATQVGYGVGILLLVPLGDILRKKRLIVTKLLLLSLALMLLGFAPNFGLLAVASMAVGLMATAAQDVVPFSADLAPEESRGAVIGKVMSGLLIGILLSRTASGYISEILGWRSVFFIFSSVIVLVALMIQVFIPQTPVRGRMAYRELLLSLLRHFREYRALRNALITQGLLGLGLSAFWTNLSFLLAGEPYALSNGQIGLFGLAGAAGALIAPVAGRISDRRGPALGILIGASLCVGSFFGMWVAVGSLAMLILGTVVFDLGVQMALISHQSIVYKINPAARASLNAIFVSGLFVSFSLGSAVSVYLYAHSGWGVVLLFCLGTSLVAGLLAVRDHGLARVAGGIASR